jgi:hypothetical protein
VPGERHERRGLRHVADDPDALERETVRDRGAGALEDRAGAELAAGERTGENVERFELDVRLARYGRPSFTCGKVVAPGFSSLVGQRPAFKTPYRA